MMAVSETVLPAAALTFTVIVTVATDPEARVPMVHDTLPVPPGAGDLQLMEVVRGRDRIVQPGKAEAEGVYCTEGEIFRRIERHRPHRI